MGKRGSSRESCLWVCVCVCVCLRHLACRSCGFWKVLVLQGLPLLLHCVCVCVREKVRVIECVCVWERERERHRECLSERKWVCLCVFVCERDRGSALLLHSVCVREKVSVIEGVCVWEREIGNIWVMQRLRSRELGSRLRGGGLVLLLHCVCVWERVSACVCVCVCVREREICRYECVSLCSLQGYVVFAGFCSHASLWGGYDQEDR